MNDKWCEIVEILQLACERHSITEREYQHEIEACLRILGWKTSNETMCSQYTINIGSSSSMRVDIVLCKNGQAVLPIEIKKPTNQFKYRQTEQLISYMRQLKLNVGLFIGENIQIYYDNPQDKAASTSVFEAEIQKSDSNGDKICNLLNYDNFTIENIEKFCQEQYQYKIKNKQLQECIREFFLQSDAVKNVVKEKFLKEGFEETALDKELSKITIAVSWNKSTTVTTEEVRTIPAMREDVRNKEFVYNGTIYRNKRQFVYTFIKEYVSTHTGIRFTELQQQFPDYLAESKALGVVRTLAFIEERIQTHPDLKKRYFLRSEEIIELNDGTKVVVCNQWGNAMSKFLDHIAKLS